MKNYIVFASLLVGSFCLQGCASDITSQQVAQIQTGKTTEADLIKLFGKPKTRMSMTANGGMTVLSWRAGHYSNSGLGNRTQVLTVTIDGNGVVTDHSFMEM